MKSLIYLWPFALSFLLNRICFANGKVVEISGRSLELAIGPMYLKIKKDDSSNQGKYIGFKDGQVGLFERDSAFKFEILKDGKKHFLFLPEIQSFISCPKDQEDCILTKNAQSWEEFEMIRDENKNTISFKTVHETFLSVSLSKNYLGHCDNNQEWEKFVIDEAVRVRLPFYLKTNHEVHKVKYIGLKNGEIKLTGRDLASKLEIVKKEGKHYLFLSEHQLYLSCPNNGEKCRLVKTPDEWEEIEITNHPENGRVSFRTIHKTFISAGRESGVIEQAKSIGDWEQFYFDDFVRTRSPFYLKTAHSEEDHQYVGLKKGQLSPTKRESAVKFEIVAKEGQNYLYLPEMGSFLSCHEDKESCHLASSPEEWEAFELIKHREDGRVSLKTSHNTFVSANKLFPALKQSPSCQEWERFFIDEFVRVQPPFYLKTNHQESHLNYVGVDNNRIKLTDRNSALTFELLMKEGKYYLFSPDNRSFISCHEDQKTCQFSSSPKPWEEVEVINHSDSKTISIRTKHGTFISANIGSQSLSQAKSSMHWERFKIDEFVKFEAPFYLQTSHKNENFRYVGVKNGIIRPTSKDLAIKFQFFVKDGQFYLYAHGPSKFLAAYPDGQSCYLSPNSEEWEKIQVFFHPTEGTISLKTIHNTFISADIHQGRLNQKPEAKEWEQFRIDSFVRFDRPFYLKTHHQSQAEAAYVGLKYGQAKLTSRSEASKFEILKKEDKFYLYSPEDFHFLSFRKNSIVVGIEQSPQLWEEVEVIRHNDGKVTFKSVHGTFLSANLLKKELTQASVLQAWEVFGIEEETRVQRSFYLKTYHANKHQVSYVGLQDGKPILTSVDNATKFELIKSKEENKYQFYAPDESVYLSAFGDNEFEILDHYEEGTVSIKTKDNTFLSADPRTKTIEIAKQTSAWERFQFDETTIYDDPFIKITSQLIFIEITNTMEHGPKDILQISKASRRFAYFAKKIYPNYTPQQILNYFKAQAKEKGMLRLIKLF